MKKNLLFVLGMLIPYFAIAAEEDYENLSLSGFNADLVIAPGDPYADAVDAQGWCFYSDEFNPRGGLPRQICGMFSDVPYCFADFEDDCALLMSTLDGSSSDSGTLTLNTPVATNTLWFLLTSTEGTSNIEITINYSDGTTVDVATVEVADWVTSSYSNTAFWQLGRMNASGTIDTYNCAFYETAVAVDSSKTINSVTFTLASQGKTAAVFAITASDKDVPDTIKDQKLFFISDSHLDTQWNWTVKTTISQYIKNTLEENFSRFEDDNARNFNFNFEGAIKYMWAKEYYPSYYSQLKEYIKEGRWNIAGGAIDANDVNIGSAESLIRNFLLAQTFYQNEFGVRGGRDIMLPDCFGFPWSLPTIAYHCGMKYFHSQKLSWSSAYAYNDLPRFARWIGTDGEEILATLKLNAYDQYSEFRTDMSYDSDMIDEVATNLSTYGIPATIKYTGPVGDRGGGLDEQTADSLSMSVDSDGPLGVYIGSSTTMLDQLYHMGYDGLPTINHGLPMRAHGVGGYTSRCMLKYWMRKGELLGLETEKASVAADWLGSLPYQTTTLNNTWIRMLWHMFHDDLPGTCINEAYKYTVNDQVLNQLDFSRTLNNAVGAVAKSINTNWCNDIPVVVYNPLSIDRTDIVEASVSMPSGTEYIEVTDKNGDVVPSQVLSNNDGDMDIIFLATVPSVGYSSYNVASSETPYSSDGTLSVSESGMENDRYKITIDSNGDVSSITDKSLNNKELLSGPIRLQMLYDESLTWPSWEIHGDQLQNDPREYVDNEGLSIEVAEEGPLRVSLKVTRTKSGSTFYQYIRLASEGSADRIDFVNEVDWQTTQRLLKAAFPLTASNSEASYDLDIGVDVNENSTDYSTDVNNTDAHCEFLGHRWADVTDSGGSFGVSILNDCKYGWDKQEDNEIRLTLIHTPKAGDNSYAYQSNQDLGLNRFTYSFFAHENSWSADTQWEADKLNEPLLAYQTTSHDGDLGEDFSFLTVNNSNVAVKAIKKAETSDKIVVRFYELTNSAQDVEAEFAADILSAEEVNGVEELIGDASYSGSKLSFSIDRFHPKTFALTLADYTGSTSSTTSPTSVTVDLDYNIDVMSYNDNRGDAEIDDAFPAELVDDEIEADGIVFTMGDKTDTQKNAVKCVGQTVSLPSLSGGNKVYLLASSLNEDGSEVTFSIDGNDTVMQIEYYGGYVGVWSNSVDVPKSYRLENTAFTATHSHDVADEEDSVYDYLYMYKYVIAVSEGASEITLPDDSDVLVYAITVSDNTNDDTTPLSQVVKVLTHTDTEDPYNSVTQEDVLTPSTIRASSYTNSSEAPEMASDGDDETKWCDNSSDYKWLEYKFDTDVVVTGWLVLNAGSEGDDMIASEYHLQRYYNNGWVDVDDVTDNYNNTTSRVLDDPAVTTGVRLRIVSGEQTSNSAARVYNFEVYGHEASEEELSTPQIISRIPTYGFGKQVARVIESTGRVNASEDPYYLLDCDKTTKWCYNGSVTYPYVIIQLSDVYDLTRFDIYDCQTNEDYDNSDEYNIYVSLDGENYTAVVEATGVADEAVHSAELPESVSARYVKLELSKGGYNAVRIYGFDIWGTLKETLDDESGEPASLDKTVLGSFNVKNFQETALNLIDGDTDNSELSWNIGGEGTSGSKYYWALIDLEDSYSLSKFVIYDSQSHCNSSNSSGYFIHVSSTEPTDSDMEKYNTTISSTKWTRVARNLSDSDDIKTVELDDPVTARYVKLAIPYNCVTDSALISEFEIYGTKVSTAIGKTSQNNDISVYPTLVSRGNNVNIVAQGEFSYAVYSIEGREITSASADESAQLSTTALIPGLYIVSVTDGDGTLNKKIVVK